MDPTAGAAAAALQVPSGDEAAPGEVRFRETALRLVSGSRVPDDVARLTVEALDCEWSAVYLTGEGDRGLVLAATYGAVAERLPDARALLFLVDRGVPPVGQQRLVCAPLRDASAVHGLLVAGAAAGGSFTARERRLAEGIALLAAPTLRAAGGAVARTAPSGTEIVATMSHELRTPLNAVVGYLDMLADADTGELSSAQHDVLEATRRSALELQGLVNATLELARLDAGRARVDAGEFAIGALLEEIAREARPHVAAAVRLAVRVGAEAAAVRTDRLKLKILLKNLVGNALKFTAEGAVEVCASAEGATLLVEVRDTGIGIPSDELPFIFERFRQGSGASGRRGGGIGLGLHIVQRLVELLGGGVQVESQQGVGTAFTMRIPGVVCTVPSD